MNAVARWLARRLWYGMLWVMRRPWMKRLQRSSLKLVPKTRRDAVRRRMVRQNQWALRHGLVMLTVSINLLLASIVLTLAYYVVVDVIASAPSGLVRSGDQ